MKADLQFALTYEGADGNGQYTGLWCTPTDQNWRSVRDAAGKLSKFASSAEAVAAAGDRLVHYLNDGRTAADTTTKGVAMAKPSINQRCVAARYAGPQEAIAEFRAGKVGGLVLIRRLDDGTAQVHLYRLDEGVDVIVSPNREPTGAIALADRRAAEPFFTDAGFAMAHFKNEHPASEGWLLARRSDGRWQIQAIDDDEGSDVLDDDFDAYAYVKDRAQSSAYHRRAIELHGLEC